MPNDNQCAHEACVCAAANDAGYCSDHCKDADEQDIVEIRCDCGHPGCA